MKFSTQEEYGLRLLLRIAKFYSVGKTLTIPEISKAEKISHHNVGKILRILRMGGFLIAERGQIGGYTLSRPPEQIKIKDVLYVLGGKLYDDSFCQIHAGSTSFCTNSIDCSLRSLWKVIQDAIDSIIENITLKDLLNSEKYFFQFIHDSKSIGLTN